MSGFIQAYLDRDEHWSGRKQGDLKPLPDSPKYFLRNVGKHKILRSKVLLALLSQVNFIPFVKK